MKKLTIILTLLILSLLPSVAANKHEANPINLAVILTEKNDSATMASVCEFYGYQAQPSQDGYTVYHHPNGSIIRFTFTPAEDGRRYATIEVKSTISSKEMDEILGDLRFQQTGNVYSRQSFTHLTRCSYMQEYLHFSNHPKPKKKQ
ncbi:MAG: hypothetical protein K2H85_02615 [Allobaculum sp.]|nr:hypothetical protein [Allobaculum sp.]